MNQHMRNFETEIKPGKGVQLEGSRPKYTSNDLFGHLRRGDKVESYLNYPMKSVTHAFLNSRTSEQIVSFSLQLLVPLVHKGTRQDIVLDVFLLGGLAYVLVPVNREQDIQLTRHSLIGVAVTPRPCVLVGVLWVASLFLPGMV